MIIRSESFYDWCQKTGNQSFLLRWDHEKNIVGPKEVYKTDHQDRYFKCANGIHESYPAKIRDIVHHGVIPKCPICNSFGYWCETHNRGDLLERWDYELNNESPYDVSMSSTKKRYFKCPKGIHRSEQKNLDNIRKQSGSSRCVQCDSFGQYYLDTFGERFFDEYWSEENTIDPMFVSRRSNKKVLIKCNNKEYHPDYEISCANFVGGKRCPYCAGKKVHKYDSLGYLYPQSIDKWVENTSPYEYLPSSNKKIYWNCSKHGKYRRKICREVASDFICPKCYRETHESKLQHKVDVYISSIFNDVRHELNCTITPINPDTNYKLPFDNEIVDLRLIIEVHGEQHYKKNSFFYRGDAKSIESQFKYRQYLDRLKKNYAISQGYQYLEIPYWTDDKKETWKMLIDRKINTIKESITANSQAG